MKYDAQNQKSSIKLLSLSDRMDDNISDHSIEISTHCSKPELFYHLEIRFAAKTELFLLIKITFIKWHVRLDCVHGYKQKQIDSFKR